MSLSIKVTPQELMPVYNEVIIVATSSLQTKLNYQLVTTITCRGEEIGQTKQIPNPEGYIVIDLQRHLENKIESDFRPEETSLYKAEGSFASYSVSFSHEYTPEWPFVDNAFASGFVAFVGTEQPDFNIGDEIFINQIAPFSFSQYNGPATITGITQSGATWSITTNKPYIGDTPANGGTMSFAQFTLINKPIPANQITYDLSVGTDCIEVYFDGDFIQKAEKTQWIYNSSGVWTFENSGDTWWIWKGATWSMGRGDFYLNSDVEATLGTGSQPVGTWTDVDGCQCLNIEFTYQGDFISLNLPASGMTAGKTVFQNYGPSASPTGYNAIVRWYATPSNYWSMSIEKPTGSTATPFEYGTNNYFLYENTECPLSESWVIDEEYWYPDEIPITTGCGLNIVTQLCATPSYPAITNKAFVFNGVKDFVDFPNWNSNDWDTQTTEPKWGKFFTNAPDNWEIEEGSSMYLNAWSNGVNELRAVRIETNLGTFTLNSSFATLATDAERFIGVPCGPKQLKERGWIDDTSTWFRIWTQNQVTTQTLEKKEFKIVRKCTRYEKIQLLFRDRMGSFIPYSFIRVERETRNISRTNYDEVFGRYASSVGNWKYNSWDRGTKSLDTIVTETHTANSDWVDQKTSDYLMELF